MKTNQYDYIPGLIRAVELLSTVKAGTVTKKHANSASDFFEKDNRHDELLADLSNRVQLKSQHLKDAWDKIEEHNDISIISEHKATYEQTIKDSILASMDLFAGTLIDVIIPILKEVIETKTIDESLAKEIAEAISLVEEDVLNHLLGDDLLGDDLLGDGTL